ncbi:non-specific lipid transfer protein GPI-anchored 13-like [Dioscorea cayenensis subsp. rotundata]|uniref:Non-specific lipid transfer protein GPI-anchored 13-like n=1 Tax=Dioscorea cayennensis subsp. rotundata TaxID=55577 RepID=A0AB40CJ88_DIOCR|nr:non-specific lipid transfer protein GPI-anchored 13-like [Dioscorea cayenensis subsp. rotundata]
MATRGRRAWYWSFVSAAMVAVVAGDFAADRAECASNLVGLSTCLTYVQGTGSAPTPDCCSGLEQVVGKSPKCLCVLIKDRNEPGLGFKFNVTRAMSLPDFCHSSANISDCPRLLNLPRDSKDAQIFEQFGNSSSSHGKGNVQSIVQSNGGVKGYYLKEQGLLGVQMHPLLLLLILPLVLSGS